MFIGIKYLDIYTLMDNVAYFKKMLVKWVEKKQVKGIYIVGYSTYILI
jgi:hypothetical protein